MQKPQEIDINAFRDYLEKENESSLRHELHFGESFALSGSSDLENELVLNIAFLFREAFRMQGKVYAQNLKLEVIPYIFYTYPDIMICRDERDKEKRFAKNFPSVIIEVVSEKNDYHARGIKLKNYLQISTLEHYLIVSSNVRFIEHYSKQSGENWLYKTVKKGDLEILGKKFLFEQMYGDFANEDNALK
jgi:Uma2 family endonuclease